jgi:redox-sensitive bicupin YhaK (pirin superfamily)
MPRVRLPVTLRACDAHRRLDPEISMTTIIAPRVHDIGGLQVRRAVPTLQARSVGPFVFIDHMGPAVFEPGQGIDVRPHPHIGLATVTFLWSGEIGHRDTLGSDQVIRPGDVNWMTAGRGIAHSERTPPPERGREHPLHGMQTWLALPRNFEETDPAFYHHGADSLPQQRRNGAWLRVIAGRAYGEESPVKVFADTLNVAIDLEADAEIDLDTGHVQRSLYVLEGQAQLDGVDIPERHLILPEDGARGRLRAKTPLKAMLMGGEPLDGPRHLWWNFVSSSKERIEQAKADWQEGRFGKIPGDDQEFIPLPETPAPPPPNYP